jgi:hypothetical protein
VRRVEDIQHLEVSESYRNECVQDSYQRLGVYKAQERQHFDTWKRELEFVELAEKGRKG